MKNGLITCVLILFASLTNAKQVVFIHSYHLTFPWVQQYREGFLNNVIDVNLSEFEMDTKRQAPVRISEIANSAWKFILKNKPDIVVLADDNALKHLGPRLVKHNIPIVFLGINENPRHYIPISPIVTGVLERPLLKRSVSMLRKLSPGINKVKVMMSESVTARVILKTAFNNRTNHQLAGITVDTNIIKSYTQWQQAVINSKSQGYNAIILATYATFLDSEDNGIDIDTITEWTGANSPIPVFSFWSFSIGKGKAIGGLVLSGKHQGSEAAEKVNDFLLHGYMGKISTPERGTLMFNRHELQRWQIVPPQAILENAIFIE